MSEVIIGRNAVLEALKNNREIEKITIAKGAEGSVKQIVGKAKDRKIPVYYSEKAHMNTAPLTTFWLWQKNAMKSLLSLFWTVLRILITSER